MPKLDNPGPGTVLDHTITRRDWYVSQRCFSFTVQNMFNSGHQRTFTLIHHLIE